MWRRAWRVAVGSVALAALTYASPVRAITFGAVADTMVDSANAGVNFGSLDFVEVGTQGLPKNAINRGLLRFDVASLPSTASISQARLLLSISASSADPLGLEVTAALLANDFDEATVTWTTQPSIIASPTQSATMNTMAGDVFQMDVTALVRAQRGGSMRARVLLRIAPTNETTTATQFFDFRTKEFESGTLRAQLVIDLGPSAAPVLSPLMMLVAVGAMLAIAGLALRRMRRLA